MPADGPRVALVAPGGETGVRWPGPAAWGIVLAALARHGALAYQGMEGAAAGDILERVLAGFSTEIESSRSQSTDGPQYA